MPFLQLFDDIVSGSFELSNNLMLIQATVVWSLRQGPTGHVWKEHSSAEIMTYLTSPSPPKFSLYFVSKYFPGVPYSKPETAL